MADDRASASIVVGVVYSPRAGVIDETTVTLVDGGSLLDAVEASGLLTRHPEIDLSRQAVGIWGRRCDAGARLRQGDRVELYRPLLIEPNEARRLRHRELLAARKRGRVG